MKNKLYTENGRLSDYGKDTFGNIKNIVAEILNTAQDESETRLLGSLLFSYIGDLVSTKAQIFIDRQKSHLWQMTDDEFQAYLDDKYKDVVAELIRQKKLPFYSMTQEECDRYQPIAKKSCEETMKEIQEMLDKQANEPHYIGPMPDPRIRYR